MRRATEDMASPDAHVLIGDSPAMQALRATLARLASSDFPILVQGESGVGKERVAIQLHRRSARRMGAFHAVNCAALTPELLESQLFGCVRGAYTGAERDRPGLLEQLDTGTLLLDEVGEMPPALQAKLLRVLEDGEYYRLGDTRPLRTGVRILAATNRDLRAAVSAGLFREDLYHRLGVLKVNVPPLRARGDDWRQLLPGRCSMLRLSWKVRMRVAGMAASVASRMPHTTTWPWPSPAPNSCAGWSSGYCERCETRFIVTREHTAPCLG
ncbi:MAG: sigma-54 factor interaction domain-containing protein [Gammaproteobacteria bacterium]|nr:sigma-54 factor interaction domain-containing protein [Gammaproteobacteria bacterium]